MPSPAISVESLSKAYRIGAKEDVPDTLAGALAGALRSPWRNLRRLNQLSNLRDGDDGDDVLWALKDVSFEVNEGEVVGIIGRNGAGKSTLLKVLSRITEPTSGRAVIRGRVSSLLEVGTGFHPELTGRENIYMNGTILGMTKREIDRKFDEIVDFSGVEKFLDTPTKRYSSGMQVRLAFAVAAHLEPEILIIDEVLAVGDAEFQKKCLGKMRDVAGGGRAVLFVSHNMAAVKGLCSGAFVLQGGTLCFEGRPELAIRNYLSLHSASHRAVAPGCFDLTSRINSYADQRVVIQSLALRDSEDRETDTFFAGSTLTARIHVSGFNRLSHAQIGVIVKSQDGVWLSAFNTGMKPPGACKRRDEECVVLTIDRLPFTPGRYFLDVSIAHKSSGRYDYVENAAEFTVEAFDVYGTGYAPTSRDGVVFMDGSWDILGVGE